ncbi:MAG: hypothetical protein ACM3TT_05355 [Syntrophothermus sp.]
MNQFEPAEKLRECRSLFLAVEAIGWLHMVGKAKADFLRGKGGVSEDNKYEYTQWFKYENPPFPWDDLLRWVKDTLTLDQKAWPAALTDFVSKHTKMDPGLLGLLQAGHGMASGIEKNLPKPTSEYLGQDLAHMWLSSAFGYPVRNLLADPPEVLTDAGWKRLVEEIRQILKGLENLGRSGCKDVQQWWYWREKAIGAESFLRQAFMSTLAETRLPNNDVTLWDQSYVAAALFKSAVAGAILEELDGQSFPWGNNDLKQKTQWRLLTIGMGICHYEARAVKIGDWTGTQRAIEDFFTRVRKLVEVDLTLGSLLYRDTEVAVFSFPGERDGANRDLKIDQWKEYLQACIDKLAQDLKLETPPYCNISSGASRSLILLTKEVRRARETMAVPVYRRWNIPETNGSAQSGHVCSVCLVRLNGRPDDKQRPCEVCDARRRHRLDDWLRGRMGNNTIWIDEVADGNDRVALLTLSLDIEPWLDGSRVDSLRAQSIAEWRRYNPVLTEYWQQKEEKRKGIDNPMRHLRCPEIKAATGE